MQMKKNYLLLFLMALLFGTANMRGQSLPWNQLPTAVKVKIGTGFVFLTETEVKCYPKKATQLGPATEGTDKITLTEKKTNLAFAYSGKHGTFSTSASSQKFHYVSEGGKYYLKGTAGSKAKDKYVTNHNGDLTFEAKPSADAEVEITAYGAGVSGGADGGDNPAIAGPRLHNTLALFQFRHHPDNRREEGPFIGTGIGQYTKPNANPSDQTAWNEVVNKMFKEATSPSYNNDNIGMMTDMIIGLNIIPVTQGHYVYVTTKSQFEDQVRENSKGVGYSNTPIDNIPGVGPSQPAKYLKATATGYTMTDKKEEAAVFYFDGKHLTGLDNGFGLGESRYDLTADAQKAVIAQGLLEKTLDAGSYSVKVGNQYVKLDRESGLSLSTNESDSHLFLEEAEKFTLHTDALGYVSFFAPTAVEVPNNVKVYTGKLNAGNTQLTFTEVSNKQIPENTAVLLQMGTSKTQFEVKKIATASAIPNNSLKGYTVSSADHKNNAYGLMAENGKLVFKRLSDGVRAFRAVIYQDNGAGTQEFILTSFAPTGIEGVTAKEKQEDVFDLAGRRVEFPVKGQVYVKGGKKFIQK